MILLPRPTDFVDWKAWATELTRRLDRSDPIKQVAEALVTGDNLSATYDASKRTITLAAAATTDEMIDDRVAALLTAGTNITLTYNDVANTLTIAAADSGLDVLDEGATISGALFDTLDFVGAGVTVTDAGGGVAEVSIPGGGGGGVVVLDEGATIAGAAFDTIDFVGAGVAVTDAGGGVAEVSIPGGSGGGGNADGRAYVTPDLTDFAWINQGAAVATQYSYGIGMQKASHSGNSVSFLKKAAPATPYTITIRYTSVMPVANYATVGVLWRDSASGKLHYARFLSNGSALNCSLTDFSSPTNPVSETRSSVRIEPWPTWFRLADNGTNRTLSLSCNGDDWLTLWTGSRTTYLTPNEVGFGINNETGGGSFDAIMTLLSWEEA